MEEEIVIKHVYRVIFLIFVFFGFIYFFGRNIKEDKIGENSTVVMGQSKFPVIMIRSEENIINKLYGYSGNLDVAAIRESITPIQEDQTFEVLIHENQTVVKKIQYELYDIEGVSKIEDGTVSSLNNIEDGKSVKIKIRAELERGKEYPIKITVITNKSKKIHFYTRLKLYQNSHTKEKLDFAMEFHNSTLDKNKVTDIVRYLETDYGKNNQSLAHVDITSSVDVISFGGLSPKVLQDIVPTICEANEETALIRLRYTIETDKLSSRKEYYHVNEYYRVRYTSERMYLLHYERMMESIFDVNLSSIAKNELKFGITSDYETEVVVNEAQTKLAFVKEKALWYMDLEENKATNVFSFYENVDDNYYDQHNIKILDISEEGKINFIVYGYMDRGDYEGRVAIVLYTFDPEDKRIAEQVYIPLDTTYQILKEDLDDFTYVTKNQAFYFSIHNVVYSYHIPTNHLETIVSDISAEDFLMSKKGKYIAWQEYDKLEELNEIHILELETGARRSIRGKEGWRIKMLGYMGENLIYGYGNEESIGKTLEGTRILPLKRVVISNKDGVVLKEYEKKNLIKSAKVNDNIIELECVKKMKDEDGTLYQKTSPEYILYNIQDVSNEIAINSRVTELALTESYLSLPHSYTMNTIPKIEKTRNTIITKDTTLRLKDEEVYNNKYYAYGIGGIVGSFENAKDAIVVANEKLGTVVNSSNQIIWQRSGKKTRYTISGLSIQGLQNHTLSNIQDKYLVGEPLNLTGCTLDEVLYFVSNDRPVIGMKDEETPIVIVGYDEFNITYIDFQLGKEIKKGLNDSGKMFENAGNIFISSQK